MVNEKVEKIFQELIEYLPTELIDQLFWEIVGDQIHLQIPGYSGILVLNKYHLNRLADSRLVGKLKGYTHHNHCGFSYYDYCEYFLAVGNSIYWPANKPLKFKINDTLIIVGSATPIITLLFEPYYSDNDIGQTEFYDYSTIRVIGAGISEQESLVHKALYYLNSYYLHPLRLSVNVLHLVPPTDPYDFLMELEGNKITRTRIFSRKDFENIEPLILFNNASDLPSDDNFLGYYKVLEYFFRRSLLSQFNSLRYDESVSNDEIINFIRNRDERSLLKKLLNDSVSPQKKRRISNYAKHSGLIKNESFKEFIIALYEYRNSVVHSKEERITDAMITNPFHHDRTSSIWSSIVRELAIIVNKKYNEKKAP